MPILALEAADEVGGTIVKLVDGGTFDLRIEETHPQIIYQIERVRLPDVDSPR